MDDKYKILISIVTVCRDSAKTIERTFESVLQQSFQDYEYVVIDGKSKDDTLSIIEKYKKKFEQKKIKFSYISEYDNGIYDAMNKGINLVCGEYINFMNSDDFFYSDMALENVASAIKRRNPDIIVGCAKLVFQDGTSYIQNPVNIKNQLLGRMPFIHQSAFVKRDLMVDNLFATEYSIAADYDFFLKMRLENRIFEKLNDVIVVYSMDGFSNMNRDIGKKQYFSIKKKNLHKYGVGISFYIKCFCISQVYNIRYFLGNSKLLKRIYTMSKNRKGILK